VQKKKEKGGISFFKILSIFPILTTALSMATSLLCLTFKEPILQLRLIDEVP
jgi:hypothetical protein